ncbi:LysR family transcriptional regulator [uncultured Aeromicrobium sp.]|uniref:LysR family transcriptional regulator n=1 Tax=uncultured Aeromicrobium sp. TaxID=337820 RepID=UPI0025F85195|nr:LysR family transcriptional regulator [uncultured Aeromicrobium sp.]
MAGSIDLNEVRTFVTLFETRSVTAAAERLHVAQPTVSYTLAKLRRRFGDDLFSRTRDGIEPSARAVAMYGPLREALLTIERTTGGPEEFDPATTEREFTALLSDFGELSFLPVLLPQFAQQAPRAWLRAQSLVVDEVVELLVRGRADLAVTSTPLRDDRVVGRPIMTVDYAAIASCDHPRIGSPLITPEEFGQERFVNVRTRSGHLGPVRLLERLGLQTRVELELTSYASAPYVVAASEAVAIVPRHIAEVFARRHALRVIELPWYVEPIEVAAYTRATPSPAQRWFADLVVDVLSRERLA